MSAFADAGVVHRNRCYWVTRKYVAENQGKNCGAWRKELARDRGCDRAESWVELYACSSPTTVRKGEGTPYRPYNSPSLFAAVFGTAKARIDGNSAQSSSWGGYGNYGFISDRDGQRYCTNLGYICMGNATAGMLFPATSPALTPTEQNNSFRSVSFDTGTREYDPNSQTMTIRDFRATLRNNPFDKVNEFSALHLSVLRSADNVRDSLNTYDDTAYKESLLASSRMMLNNGKLLVDGVLQNARIATKDSAGYQIVTVDMPVVQLRIAQNVNPDEVTLNMSTDVGLLTDGVSVRYMPTQERTTLAVADASSAGEVLEFSSSPNPTTRSSATTVYATIKQTQQVTIGLYQEDNTLALPIYSGELEGNTQGSFPVDLRALTPGTYYLRLERTSSRLTRRVVIQ
jgi:hypothetical protein